MSAGATDRDAPKAPSALQGTWLIGWAGGLRHYSWARFTDNTPGNVMVLDGRDLPSNAPYWACNGSGSFTASQDGTTLQLSLPAPCPAETLTVVSSISAQEQPGAIDGATVNSPHSALPLRCFKFPDSQCDAGMTACANPF
jgi:hypothetical protein